MSNYIIYDEPTPRGKVVAQLRVGANVVTFNAAASKALGLKAGDKVAFAQDPKNLKDWYVRVAEKGFVVRVDKASSEQIDKRHLCNANHVISKIRSTMAPCKSFVVNLATEPDADGWHAIITNSAKCKL
jgi:hypothetical protein